LTADRVGRLTIGQILAKLQSRHEDEAPRCQPWLTMRRIQIRESLVGKEGTHLVRETQIEIALGKGGVSNAGCLIRNRANRLGTEHSGSHHNGLRNDASGSALGNLQDQLTTSPTISTPTKSR